MAVQSLCGVILVTENVEALATFYRDGLGLEFEREEHGGLAPHYGIDLGTVHFAIHPPSSFPGRPSTGGAVLAFAVSTLDAHLPTLEKLGAELLTPARDQGFGLVATLADPDGNRFELVELTHQFGEG